MGWGQGQEETVRSRVDAAVEDPQEEEEHADDMKGGAGVKVAIIGAGPSGLTCAHHLAKRGYQVTIFEMLSEPGGMAAVGIPDYRLPREIVRYEVEAIEALGVRIVATRLVIDTVNCVFPL